MSLYGEVQKEVIEATLADRLRDRGHVPRDDDAVCRAPGRSGGGGRARSRSTPIRSWPRSGCGSSAGRAGQRGAVRAGGGTGLDAVRVLRRRRGDRARDAAPGLARLAGDRLRGHHDALGVLGAAEPLTRDVRQEHVEHGRGLPLSHAVGADGRRCGRRARWSTNRCTASGSTHRPTASVRSCRCWRGWGRCRGAVGGARYAVVIEGEIPAARVHELEQRLPGADPGRRRGGVGLRSLSDGAR